MCGIVGFLTANSNGFGFSESDAFRDMLFLDTLRGQDSTGIYGVDRHGNVAIHKKAVTGGEFIKTKEFNDFLIDQRRNGVFMVGHNRAATKGKVSDENAHPFYVNDKIILVHNGTLRSDHKKIADVEVDTHALAHALAANDNIEEVLQGINGAYALAWYNVEQKKLSLLRNVERPLHIARTKAGGLMFASEMEFILFAAHRAKVELQEKPYMLKEHSLCEYTLDGKGSWEVDYREVDVRYRFTRGSPFRPGFDNTDDYGAGYGSWVGNVTREVIDDTCGLSNDEVDHRLLQRKRQVTTQFSKYLETFRREAWMDVNEGEEAMEYSRELVGRSHAIVEIEDFVPANNHPDCRVWFIYGRAIDAVRDEDAPAPVIYWIKHDMDKQQATDYAAHGFYRVKVMPYQSTMFKTPGDKNKVVVMCYGSEQIPAVVETESMENS